MCTRMHGPRTQIDHLGLALQFLSMQLGFEYHCFNPLGAYHGRPMTVDVPRVVDAVVGILAGLNATMAAL